MTLENLINKKILYGNINLAQSPEQQHKCAAGATCDGCSCVHNRPLLVLNRNYGLITTEAIIKAGGEKYLKCKVVSVFAHKPNKLGIEIKLPI